MIYRIKSNRTLFEEWTTIEQAIKELKLISPSNTIKNDIFLTTEQLNESFSILHQTLVNIKDKYPNQQIQAVISLRDKTVNYINNLNKLPISLSEFDDFREHCSYFKTHMVGFANQSYDNPPTHHCTHPKNRYQAQDNCNLQNCPLVDYQG